MQRKAAIPVHMQCRGSRRAFPAAEKKTGGFMFHGGSGMKRGFGTVCFVTHALRRSQFSPSESPSRPFLRFRSVFPAENFTIRKFSAGNRKENAQTRRNGRTLMKKGKLQPVGWYHRFPSLSFRPTEQDFYAIVPMEIVAIPP